MGKTYIDTLKYVVYGELEISGLVDKLDDPVYSTSIGLMLWGRDKSQSNFLGDGSGLSDVFNKTKKFFKQFLP